MCRPLARASPRRGRQQAANSRQGQEIGRESSEERARDLRTARRGREEIAGSISDRRGFPIGEFSEGSAFGERSTHLAMANELGNPGEGEAPAGVFDRMRLSLVKDVAQMAEGDQKGRIEDL